ncbi:hypothetical protein D3C86_2112570 [compost metagenome]
MAWQSIVGGLQITMWLPTGRSHTRSVGSQRCTAEAGDVKHLGFLVGGINRRKLHLHHSSSAQDTQLVDVDDIRFNQGKRVALQLP